MEPAGRLGLRGVVLRLLREARPHGIDQREVLETHGIACLGGHIESLQAEGHGIMRLDGRDEEGRSVIRYYLRHDEWAALPDLEAA